MEIGKINQLTERTGTSIIDNTEIKKNIAAKVEQIKSDSKREVKILKQLTDHLVKLTEANQELLDEVVKNKNLQLMKKVQAVSILVENAQKIKISS